MKCRKWAVIAALLIVAMVAVPVRAIHQYGKSIPDQADVIIVLGCKLNGDRPSLFLQYRLNAALQVYEQGLAKYIIVSGGQGPDEWVPEAVAMMDYLVDRGVPEHRVFTESKSTSTYENLKFSKAIMDANGFSSARHYCYQ